DATFLEQPGHLSLRCLSADSNFRRKISWLPLHEILEPQKHSFARYFPADPNFQRERSYSSRKSVMFAGFGFGCFLSEA
ncbi:MAG: hypothetical protein KAI72_06920, partial [Candidatus Pacebacteria bacterium]|nr:hypothetical protein [Candidatus Paceibacterota bacterium]